jgi:excisionase family DNA binding protein
MTNVLLSVEEAAERLGGVSRWTVYTWMSQKRLRKTKIGSRVMISENDLQAFIARCNPEPEPIPNSDSSRIVKPNVQ